MVGAGAIINALVGIDFSLAVIGTGAFMLVYVIFGGMLATTWVQIVKAVLLMTATVVLTLFVLGNIGWNPLDIFNQAEAQSDDGAAYLEPGLRFTEPIDTISLGLGLVLGTAGLPHILMRFFTVPNAKAARSSVVWAVGLIGAFYVMTTFLGFGARAILGEAGATGGVDEAGNLAAPLLAQEVGGGAGTVGGDAFLAVIAAVAFATILAVVAGLVISASGAVAHDFWSNVVRSGKDSESEEIYVARIAAFMIGAISIAIAVIGGSDLNVSYMVGLAFAVAASANFPALLLALTWKRFNTTGAVTGVLVGVVSSLAVVLLGPDVRGEGNGITVLTQPAIISVPLGFFGCWLGTMLGKPEPKADGMFDELRVRAETGIGAEEVEAGPIAREPKPPSRDGGATKKPREAVRA
jgi:cation/acetate symporter